MNETRQRIINSLFNNPASGNVYESHVKVWEDDEQGGRKPRFIVLAFSTISGRGKMFKTKLNTTGTYSIGKTWELDSLRGVEVIDPRQFKIVLARSYKWDTESQVEQVHFLNAIVRLFERTNPGIALNIVGTLAPPPPPMQSPPPVASTSSQTRTSTRSPDASRQPGVPSITRRPSAQHNRTASGSSTVGSAPFANPSPPRDRRPNGDGVSTGPRGVNPVIQRTTQADEPPPRAMSPLTSSRSASRLRSPESQGTSRANDTVPPTIPPVSPPINQRSTARAPPPPPPGALRGSSPGAGAGIGSFRTSAASSTVVADASRDPTPTKTRINGTSSSRKPSEDYANRGSLDIPRPISPASSMGSRSRATARGPSPIPPSVPPPPRIASPPRRPKSPPIPATTPTSRPRRTPERSQSDRSDQMKQELASRATIFDPKTQHTVEKLLSQEATGVDDDLDEEDLEATLANVEEILEEYDWASGDPGNKASRKDAADQIEARLITELNALEKASTHVFIESDDRVNALLGLIDEAVEHLDLMDKTLSSYKIHLNVVGDDITHIQSQNRGLQVQTQNQRALLEELEQILQTVNVDPSALAALIREELNNPGGIQRLEEAATELYKALQASRDKDMAASMERLDEYIGCNRQFCKRLFDFLLNLLATESKETISSSKSSKGSKSNIMLQDHKQMEQALGQYCGLILYLKEMDEDRYGKLCAAYFSTASDLHKQQITTLLLAYASRVKKATEEDGDNAFGGSSKDSKQTGGLRRAGTSTRTSKEKTKDSTDEEMRGYEALSSLLDQLSRQVRAEENFLGDFLQINDTAFTFADYMNLESYYRRQAANFAGLSATTSKLIRGAIELIFGFLPEELKQWVDAALQRDSIQIIGMLASLESFLADVEDQGTTYFVRQVEKQHVRTKTLFDRHVKGQIRAIENTKLDAKKRRGVAHFIKYFPVYVQRVESQLVRARGLEVRGNVDDAYERIVEAMFDALQQMAKLDGDGEDKDKGELNYHVIIIENMHYFLIEMGQLELPSVAPFARRAQGIYDENLAAYIKLVLRRPFAKLIDYLDGVERLMQTTAPSEVPNTARFNKASMKRLVKEYDAKDIKKLIDALYKRVEKHFTDEESTGANSSSAGTLTEVWKAIEEEMIKLTGRVSAMMVQCYAGTGLSLEYSTGDLKAAFKRRG